MNWYKLDDNQRPVLIDDGCIADGYHDWLESLPESSHWYVAKTGVGLQLAVDYVAGMRVSTVFLGMDHNWVDSPPILWETMVFDDSAKRANFDLYQNRYTSHADAVEGHKRTCRLVASEGPGVLRQKL